MIKLSSIRYEKKNETGFVLLGGKRTTNAMEAINHLDDVNTLIHRLETAIAERKARQGTTMKTVSGALITRKKSDNSRYFLGV